MADEQQDVCAHCKEPIKVGAKKCPHCQSDLRGFFSRYPLVTFVLISIFGIIIIASLPGGNYDNSNSNSTANTTPKEKSVSVGQNGILKIGNSNDDVLLALTEKDFDNFMKASIAKDITGATDLVISGRMFYVPAGTKALVIDISTFRRKVRIIDGKMKGKTGWVPFEHIVAE